MKVNFRQQNEKGKMNESLVFDIEVDPKEIRFKETPAGIKFEFSKDFKNLNEPGAPAVPARIINVALPANAVDIEVNTTSQRSRKLFKQPVFITPVEEYQVGIKNEEVKRLDKDRIDSLNQTIRNTQFETRAIPTTKTTTLPNPEKYNKFLKKSDLLAELQHTTLEGNNVIAYIRINPITIGDDYIPVLHEAISVKVNYTFAGKLEKDRKLTVRSFSHNKVMQDHLIDQIKDKVINPFDIVDLTNFPWYIFGQYDYLVITDNYLWNSERIEPGAYVGDMVAQFEKLAAWKRQKGLKAKVVTITDIVNGLYGNFKTGAVDLQEVIRNFLKFAHSNWGVAWCLLGGDVEIVPVRQAAGECRGDIAEQTTNNPPHDNEAFWTGSFMKIKAVSLGEWFSVHDNYLKLTSKTSGRLIPKKSPRNRIVLDDFQINGLKHLLHELPYDFLFETTEQFQRRLGWYFCTDETYTTYSSTPTNFVRVDGNASIIHTPLRFHYTWNTIPTDFYYASLFGPNYGLAGKHDWDLNNNGIYGQHEWNNDFDPINWNADIMVGRAPASTPQNAEVFVKKVIAYEKFRMEDGTSLDRNYLDKMLLVSTNWGGRIGFYPTTVSPPAAGNFFTDAPNSRAIIQTNADFTKDWQWELISWINDTDVWLIPYNKNAAPGVRGWYYAFGPADLRPAIIEINIWGLHLEFPIITNTIVTYGNASDIAPQYFILDRVEADGSMMDSEALRIQMDAELPVLRRFTRLYEDIDSLPIANRNAAPVARFTDGALVTALNEGHHFLSLSGHGSMGGCCGVDSWKASSATNGNKYFIAFADSCLTNDFGYNDSMSESLLNNPNGGAVAYVGHTRFSWIGLGDDFERAFFHALVNTRHLGLMHNSRLNVLFTSSRGPLDHYNKWSVLALNLLGDPEMEVRKTKPRFIIPDIFFEYEKLYIKVFEDGFARAQVKQFNAMVIAGEQSYLLKPDEDGKIPFETEWLANENLKILVHTDGDVPFAISGSEIKFRLEQSKVETRFEFAPEIEEKAEAKKATSEVNENMEMSLHEVMEA
jgi:hypothetical protein